jgi:hypothetical protein
MARRSINATHLAIIEADYGSSSDGTKVEKQILAVGRSEGTFTCSGQLIKGTPRL